MGVADKARRILEEYPLCDRCLGRLFARLGYGWSNAERGDAIKRVLVMDLHEGIREGSGEALAAFKRLAPRIGAQAAPLYRTLTGEELSPEPCYICGGILDEFIARVSDKARALLDAYDISRYVVGVKASRDVVEREERIREEYGLSYGESIRAEIRREVGKRLMGEGRAPDFADPEATVLVEFPSGNVEVQVNSLLIRGRYWKLARYISQAYWPSPTGPRYFSVEEAAWGLLRLTGGERVVVHAAGREDVDARMLGSGRPLIIEVKSPRRRRLGLEELEEAANSNGRGLVEFRVEGFARRRDVALYKGEYSRMRKAYKALVVFHSPVSRDDLAGLEDFFRGRRILQRTPRRVLHRRADILRRRTIHEVRCRPLSDQVAECLIVAEGGLYVKELVSGDEGRTTPSFAEYLGTEAECVELDVVMVEFWAPKHSTLKPGGETG